MQPVRRLEPRPTCIRAVDLHEHPLIWTQHAQPTHSCDASRERVCTIRGGGVRVSRISKNGKISFGGLVLGCIKTRKYAFDSIVQVLQDVHTFAPLLTQNGV